MAFWIGYERLYSQTTLQIVLNTVHSGTAEFQPESGE